MTEESQLLERYAHRGDQEAFTELVRRYLDLVYSAALRHVRDAQLAEDVAQQVFRKLAVTAGRLPKNQVLCAWLYTDTRLVALQLLRTERRRRAREQAATEMQLLDSHTEADWAEVCPMLDEALHSLGARDREAVLLRFFEQRTLNDVGRALGLGEDATRMRVNRALEKLRRFLQRRGVVTSAGSLAALMSAHAVQGAPAGLSSIVLSSAFASSASTAFVSGSISNLIHTGIMAKAKTILVGTIITVGVATPIAWQHRALNSLHAQNLSLHEQIAVLQSGNDESVRKAEAAALESERLRKDLTELAQLRNRVATLQRQLDSATSAPAPASPQNSKPENEVIPVTDADATAMLQRPPSEQGTFFGQLRRQTLDQPSSRPAEVQHGVELASRIRPALEALESRPADFAAFQASFIKETARLEDSDKVARIQEIIQRTYEQAVQEKLDAASRPEDNVQAWAFRRDKLDRPATRAVQELLTPDERALFDRAFLGVMGIDLGINDGGWHRFITPEGGYVFPSESGSSTETITGGHVQNVP